MGCGTRAARVGWIGIGAGLVVACATSNARADEPAASSPEPGRAWAAAPAGTAARPGLDQPGLVRPVPPPPPPPVSRTYMNCVGCAIAGGIVLGAGALHAVVGAIDLYDPGPGDEDDGRVLLVLAGVHGAVGIPLLVAGVWPIERTGARAANAPAPPAPPVEVAVGPLGGSVRLSF